MAALASSISYVYDLSSVNPLPVTPYAPPGAADGDLYRRFVDARDEEALAELVRRHWERLFRVAWRIVRDPALAEDVAQLALAKATGRGGWRGDGTLAAWLTRIVVNEARNAAVARRRRALHEEGAGAARTGRPASGSDAGADLERRELEEAVDVALAGLPEDLRVPLVLRYAEGLTHEEVAGALGLPGGTASSRLRRGLERLRESLAGTGLAAALPSTTLETLLARLPAGPAAPVPPSAAVISARIARLADAPAGRTPLPSLAATLAELAARARRAATKARVAAIMGGIAIGLATALYSAGPWGGSRPPVTVAALRSPEARGTPPVERAAAQGEKERPAEPAAEPPAPDAAASHPRAPTPEPGADRREGDSRPALPETAPLIAGRVLAAEGAPIGDAQVILTHSIRFRAVLGRDLELETRTDGEGRFAIGASEELRQLVLDGLARELGKPSKAPRTSLLLFAARDGMEPRCIPVALGEGPVEVRLAQGGAVLEGKVIDREKRTPLALVTVSVAQEHAVGRAASNGAFLELPARTDASGTFRMGGLAAGSATIGLDDDRFGEASLEVTLRRTAPAEAVLEASPAATLSLEVVDASGAPLPRFAARVAPTGDRFEGLGSQRPGTNGRLTVTRLNAGVDYDVHVGAGGKFSRVAGPLSLAAGEQRAVRVVFGGDSTTGGRSPHGQVLDPDGRPVPGARVRLSATGSPGLETTSDGNGRFSFGDLPAGSLILRLDVEAGGYAPERINPPPAPGALPAEIEQALGTRPEPEIIVRLRRVATIAVLVRSAELAGDALASTLEAAIDPEPRPEWRPGSGRPAILSTESGAVEVAFEVPAGTQRATVALRVKGSGWAVVEDVAPGAKPVAVTLATGPGARVLGRVLLPDGKPAAGVFAQVLSARGAELSIRNDRVGTGEDGRFELPDLPRIPLTLKLSGSGYRARVVSVQPGTIEDLGEIFIEPEPEK